MAHGAWRMAHGFEVFRRAIGNAAMNMGAILRTPTQVQPQTPFCEGK
ncbi:MAG TPA: hypothetical protein VH643_10035 [Gemmataceae bacterium]|jgi:hypothetical protein